MIATRVNVCGILVETVDVGFVVRVCVIMVCFTAARVFYSSFGMSLPCRPSPKGDGLLCAEVDSFVSVNVCM